MTKSNSLVFQMMISSLRRETSTEVIVSTKLSSATTSRAAVPSMEFSTAASNPRSAATASGSMSRVLPASAPEP